MAGLGNSFLVLFLTLHTFARAEIIKPYGEWLCNYCSMGKESLSGFKLMTSNPKSGCGCANVSTLLQNILIQ